MPLLALLAASAVAACGKHSTEPQGVVCTTIAVAGLNLTIVDSLTSQPPPAAGISATATEGAYKDSTNLTFVDQQSGAVRMALVYERAGTYTVTVHAVGYRDWVKSGVTVAKDVCHVIGVSLTARLVK